MSTLLNSGFELLNSSGEILPAGFGLLEDPVPSNVVLVVDDAAHAHTAESPALSQANTLAVAAAEHAHTAESPTLSQVNTLSVAAAEHGHTAGGSLALVQAHVLVVEGAAHAHSAEPVSFPTISVEFIAATGLTLTAKMFQLNSDVIVGVTDAVVEQANVKGMYVASFTEELLGAHLIVGYDGGSAVAAYYVMLDSTSVVHRSGNYADVVAASTVELLRRIAQNKTVTDPVTGLMTVYSDDDVTPLLVGQLFEGTDETQTYRGRGAEVRRRLE